MSVCVHRDSLRRVSVRVTPSCALNHWRSASINEINAMGTSQMLEVSSVMSSYRFFGGHIQNLKISKSCPTLRFVLLGWKGQTNSR